MTNLLRLEWMKFRKNAVFKVMIVLYLILLPSVMYMGKSINELPTELGSNDMFYIFPSVWRFLGYIGNWLSFFFLGFLGVLAVTSEYAYRTLRQNIINGLDRREFFLAKLVFVLTICLAATLYYFLIGMAYGITNTETIYLSRVFAWNMYFRYFLMCVGYMIFGLFLGTLIRKTGLALFLYLTYIMFGEPVIRWAIHMKFFPGKSMHFYPMNAVEDLMPIPFAEIPMKFIQENNFSLFLSPGEAIATVLVFSSFFLWAIYYRLKTADL